MALVGSFELLMLLQGLKLEGHALVDHARRDCVACGGPGLVRCTPEDDGGLTGAGFHRSDCAVAGMYEQGMGAVEVVGLLRVTTNSVVQWRRGSTAGGEAGLASKARSGGLQAGRDDGQLMRLRVHWSSEGLDSKTLCCRMKCAKTSISVEICWKEAMLRNVASLQRRCIVALGRRTV